MVKMLKIECRHNRIHPSLGWSSKQHSCARLSPLPAASPLASHLECLGCHKATRRPQLLGSHPSHRTAKTWLRLDILVLSRSISAHQVLQPGATCPSEGRWRWWGSVVAMELNRHWRWWSLLCRGSSHEMWSAGDQWAGIEVSRGKQWRKSRANTGVRGLILGGCCG